MIFAVVSSGYYPPCALDATDGAEIRVSKFAQTIDERDWGQHANGVGPGRLLTTVYEAMDAYTHWLRIIIDAASVVVDGKTNLDEIYASERKASDTEFFRNFM